MKNKFIEQDTIEKSLEEFREKFFRDETGERVNGYLAMKTGKWDCLAAKGDNREYCKIAIPDDVEAFFRNKLQQIRKEGREDTDLTALWLLAQKEAIAQYREELKEWIKGVNLCDYPKSSSQKEHEYNMEIIDEASNKAKELIINKLSN